MPDLNAKVGRLEKGVVVLASDVEALTDQVVVEKNWRRRFTIAASLGVVTVVALVGVLIWLALGNRSLLAKFNECTNPGTKAHPHACYDKGQQSQGKAVGQIVDRVQKSSAYAVECVIGGRADVEKCVEERFAGGPPPAAVAAAEKATDSGAPIATATATTTTTPPQDVATTLPALSAPAPAPPTTVTGTTVPAAPVTEQPPPTTVTSTPPPVNPCSLDLKVFCLGLTPAPSCPSVAGMCLPTITTKGT